MGLRRSFGVTQKSPIKLLASAARTASGNSASTTKVPNIWAGAFFLRVTAKAGTAPTLTVYVRAKDPQSGDMVRIGKWTPLDDTTGLTFREVVRVVGAVGDEIDVEWTIAGTTPSWTFEVGLVMDE